jgi:hypothetical protein
MGESRNPESNYRDSPYSPWIPIFIGMTDLEFFYRLILIFDL